MTKQISAFLTADEAKSLIESPCASDLFDYVYERVHLGVDHDTWLALWEIDFPRDKFVEVARCGVTAECVTDLFGNLEEMFEENPKYADRFAKICQSRYDDYCNALTEDKLSVDQAFGIATRPYGEPYESSLVEVLVVESESDDEYWWTDESWWVGESEDFTSDNPIGGYDSHEGGGNAGPY